jgi:hypothetical protein
VCGEFLEQECKHHRFLERDVSDRRRLSRLFRDAELTGDHVRCATTQLLRAFAERPKAVKSGARPCCPAWKLGDRQRKAEKLQ